ncbi:hypothetical protein STEG23_025415, partial [Scotinomys teguina]
VQRTLQKKKEDCGARRDGRHQENKAFQRQEDWQTGTHRDCGSRPEAAGVPGLEEPSLQPYVILTRAILILASLCDLDQSILILTALWDLDQSILILASLCDLDQSILILASLCDLDQSILILTALCDLDQSILILASLCDLDQSILILTALWDLDQSILILTALYFPFFTVFAILTISVRFIS